MPSERSGGGEGSKHPDDDNNEAPETLLDEPRPPRIQDPLPQPEPKYPYVVTNKAPATAHEDSPVFRQRSANQRGWGPASLENWRRRVNTGERKERRGFASMSAEKQREIASKGGRAAHEKGTAHEWSADEARTAGRKGGQVSRGGRGRLIVPNETAAQTSQE